MMTIYIKELKQSIKPFLIWTISIAAMILICILIFPEMKNEMDSMSNLFSNMGSFTEAFGMDKLKFGELMGFYGVEIGNVIGIGGGFFAAIIGVSVLAKEERERTAEFLLTHPISRASVISQKLLSVITQIIVMNCVVVAISVISSKIIGEELQMKEFILLHIAFLIMQLEISCICFGISAFLKRGSIGIGIGIALAFYFINIICNITENAKFLKYITPYAYADAGSIISASKLETNLILLGALFSITGVAVAYIKYMKKDIAA